MVLIHSFTNESGKKTSLFHLLRLTFFFILVLISTFSVQNIHAAEITLAWDQNSEPDIAGYRIYYGQESRSYTNVVDVGNYTSCTIADLEDGKTYFFAATAYNTDGYESGYSNEVTNTEPITTPGEPPDDNAEPETTPDQSPDDGAEPVTIPDQSPDDVDGDVAGGGGGSGGGSSCFVNTAASGFPLVQLKESTICALSKIKSFIQHIVFRE